MVNASDSGRVKLVVSLSKAHLLPKKALVIPRKRWLCPNMTEKLFTGTLRINQPTNLCLDIADPTDHGTVITPETVQCIRLHGPSLCCM